MAGVTGLGAAFGFALLFLFGRCLGWCYGCGASCTQRCLRCFRCCPGAACCSRCSVRQDEPRARRAGWGRHQRVATQEEPFEEGDVEIEERAALARGSYDAYPDGNPDGNPDGGYSRSKGSVWGSAGPLREYTARGVEQAPLPWHLSGAGTQAAFTRDSTARVAYEWGGRRREGTLQLDELHSASSLLEALIDLADVLLGTGVVTAAQSQVSFEAADGTMKRLSVTRTKWAELDGCAYLEVRRLER